MAAITTDLLITIIRDLGAIAAGLVGSCCIVYFVFSKVKSEE